MASNKKVSSIATWFYKTQAKYNKIQAFCKGRIIKNIIANNTGIILNKNQ